MIDDLKPYPEYKESGLPWASETPAHWNIYRAKALLDRVDERSKTGKEELLTVSSARGVIPRKSAKVTMFKAESYLGYKLCWPGDLVINSLWAWGGGLGVSKHHGIISSAYGVYRTRPTSGMNPEFLHELVRSTAFNWEMTVRSKGVWISRLQLTDESFLNAPIYVPPPDEQAAIVRFLGHLNLRVDQAIRSKRKLIALLNEQKQAIIHKAVTRGLDPNAPLKDSGIPWIGQIPSHWEALSLKRVLLKMVDCEHKTAPHADDTGLRVVRTTAVRNGLLRLQGTYCTTPEGFRAWTRRCVPKPGDVIFTREAPAGEACRVPDGIPVCLGQRTVLLRPRTTKLTSDFLIHQVYQGPPRVMITLATQGSTVGHFNMSDIGAMTILLPPVHEQNEIVTAISEETRGQDLGIYRIEREIDLLREYRTRLVSDVVTGKLDVRVAAAQLPPEGEESDPIAESEELDELDDEAVEEAA